MNELTTSGQPTITSLEIAELTDKRHKHVLADIERVLAEVEIRSDGFTSDYKDAMNRSQKMYKLPRRECDLIISGYVAKYRLAIVDRWYQLETEKTQPLSLEQMTLQVIEGQQKKITEQQKQIEHKDKLIIASNEASIKAGEILVREFVKSNDMIDIGEKKFYQWMRDQGLLLKDSCQPYQLYVSRGFFTWKPSEEEYGGKFRYTLRITPRGKIWLASRYMSYLDNDLLIPLIRGSSC